MIPPACSVRITVTPHAGFHGAPRTRPHSHGMRDDVSAWTRFEAFQDATALVKKADLD